MKIKDTYVGVAILIAIISIIFLISISQKNTNNTDNTQISYQNELIKDSIRTEYTKKIISLRDSLIFVFKAFILFYKVNTQKGYKSRYNQKENIFFHSLKRYKVM